jgi:hypothetical protein
MGDMRNRKLGSNRGSSTIEFVLISSFFWVPIILGLFTVGFGLLRGMSCIQLTRNVGHMWARGVNFAAQANQNLLSSQLAQGLDLVTNQGNVTGGNTGNGVVVLSIFTNIGAAQCTGCNNAGHTVVIRRVIVGNKSQFTTAYGAPDASLIDAATGDVRNYANDPSARADSFSNVMTLNPGDLAYFAESYISSPDLALPGLFPGMATYSNAIF